MFRFKTNKPTAVALFVECHQKFVFYQFDICAPAAGVVDVGELNSVEASVEQQQVEGGVQQLQRYTILE